MKIVTTILLPSILVLISCSSLGQTDKNNFKFNVGALYRITPVPLENGDGIIIPSHKVFVETDRQLMSGGICLGLSYYFHNKSLNFQYNQIIRYGYIHSGSYANLTTPGIEETHSGLMTDFQFLFYKNFKTKKEASFIVGLGYSALNRGTNYTYTDSTNPVSVSTYTDNLNFSAFNLALGYQIREKLKFELMNYFTNHTNYENPGKLLLFEFRISCLFDIFKK